ncbi:FAD binding domain-containing protein [Actinacidiphila glaucinigra]|uniref:FAD binding domain-containing protein n=1 Tax=Actinacidiphila glaucinigra TaxID=235986 RepID=UPI002DD89D96|nr:FAD binding domain-containing protein [Actinacidiphila glaucinigra]WSD58131.1 FAD binding domain-containing protein [Actinacidiphila glaucinigra]
MLLHLPTSVPEAQEFMAQGAVPVGGATLVWATWQRDGFPERAMSLRNLPEANAIEREALGAAVVLNRIDDRVPEVLRRAAAGVGTGAVRRTATVGGNLVGSTLRCLLPAALVLGSRAIILEPERTHETDLAEAVAKQHLLLGIRWREPLVSTYDKLPGEAGGPPPLVVAAAVHAADEGRLLRVAVRDGHEVLGASAPFGGDTGAALHALQETDLAALHPEAWEVVRRQVTGLAGRLPGA